ncbi:MULTISPECIES: UDP-N-acetylmuramoyl-tripeptide--D-alanyl-D-alanine ligase [unclassified Arenibacter]|uniref:UDP-N-acetylmuramoyl-tripeptide--D-alanyl-D- alanine ligase n=1 Tax=unclassified Arenibacter TaxID=2615047 RepID=UPI000E34060B|nr:MULTISPECIES: UDP-N-acetylmuramoyl-tripeptide--D-alanyl-D-alanine ligase [unclassified Arenibacter]MCM4164447.1 UDP-N-acetylmuramoyl-tripeptide--D-alanyl-D-alanine ligase [Arenibacter sp. A80]RFT56218.1 UDP-N-acetylmuramoyl-tripeptide--D-alanyl-D-alanine ligase [Arenibacter sp. P308M17]
MTLEQLHQLFLEFPQVCTDTRKISPNCLFFALKGDNFNGNSYAAQALDKGASYAVVDEDEFAGSHKTILVKNVLTTLQNLAQFHRNYCKAKVIGLTGSNGKTTTKELITAVLSRKYKTIATKGNLNNHIGVPLTLLSIAPDTEMAIVEMGANHLKEIEFLCELARPDYGYITNFGKAHLEGFGSEEGVIKGKSELYDFLTGHDKSIFFNADDPIQKKKLASVIKKYGFSQNNNEFFKIELIGSDPFVKIAVDDIHITTQLVGSYNFTNCCAAILIGKFFNVALSEIKKGIENYIPQNNRSQIIDKNGHHIILDAYNANPTSMKAALENFHELKADYKVAFLGDMFELGKMAEKEHQEIANLATNMNMDQVFLIGENFFRTKDTYNKFRSFDHLKETLNNDTIKNATILIKGSRGMALERILDLL